jgi:tRNA dimethylallyltransferase
VNGEVINCDAIQCYRGLGIGSAKPAAEELEGVPHHLLDIAEPTEWLNARDFSQLATKTAQDILSRGKTPIFCGGSGLYLDSAVFQEYDFSGRAPDQGQRESLERFALQEGNEALHALLASKDPQTASKIHPNNTKRVIRALEAAGDGGSRLAQASELRSKTPRYSGLRYAVLYRGREELYQAIDRRVDQMMEMGLVGEVQALINRGLDESSPAMRSIGNIEIMGALKGERSLEEAAQAMKRASRRYAKRQITWFKRNEGCIWINMGELSVYEAAHITANLAPYSLEREHHGSERH